MKKRNLFVRIMAIILCALMILGVLTAAISAFSFDAATVPSPNTGSNPNTIWAAVAGAAAVLACAICVISAKKSKK